KVIVRTPFVVWAVMAVSVAVVDMALGFGVWASGFGLRGLSFGVWVWGSSTRRLRDPLALYGFGPLVPDVRLGGCLVSMDALPGLR
ncbi:MAG: hypothetical protein ACYTF9_03050, partial [Planctomycetota bacterium]